MNISGEKSHWHKKIQQKILIYIYYTYVSTADAEHIRPRDTFYRL